MRRLNLFLRAARNSTVLFDEINFNNNADVGFDGSLPNGDCSYDDDANFEVCRCGAGGNGHVCT